MELELARGGEGAEGGGGINKLGPLRFRQVQVMFLIPIRTVKLRTPIKYMIWV